MRMLSVIFKRQLVSYACAPATYLSTAVFLATSTMIVFQANRLLEQNSADLLVFFQLHPWVYLLLTPVLSTQLWSDEHRRDSLEFVKSLPITHLELVLGKFLAAWVVAGIALLLTFPLVITVNYLGTPDNAVIASQFLGSWLLAGSYLSVGCFICTLAHHRFAILLLTLGLLMMTTALSSIIDAIDHQASIWLLDQLASLSPSKRFDTINQGVFDLQGSFYFISMIIAFLTATTLTLNVRKG